MTEEELLIASAKLRDGGHSPEDSFIGEARRNTWPKVEGRCPECGGRRMPPDEAAYTSHKPCPTCGGTGKLPLTGDNND